MADFNIYQELENAVGEVLPADGAYPAAMADEISDGFSGDTYGSVTYVDRAVVKNVHAGTVLGFGPFRFADEPADDSEDKVIEYVEDAEDQIFGGQMTASSGMGIEIRGHFSGQVIFALDAAGTEQVGYLPLTADTDRWHFEPTETDDIFGEQRLYFIFDGEGSLDLRQFAFL